jgi:hypothetical protein
MLPGVDVKPDKPIKIPEWAPPALAWQLPHYEEHAGQKSADAGPDWASACAILTRLVTDMRMERVWRLLRQREGFSPVELFWTCRDARAAWRAMPKLTRAEVRDFHLSLADSARKLRELLRTDEGSRHLDWDLYPEVGAGYWRRLIIDEPDEDGIGDPIELPTLDVILTRLEQNARAKAGESARGVPRPTAPDAHVRFVAYQLSDYCQRSYGMPLHDIVATVTNVVCEADVDEEDVRGWIRTRNEAERKQETPTP